MDFIKLLIGSLSIKPSEKPNDNITASGFGSVN